MIDCNVMVQIPSHYHNTPIHIRFCFIFVRENTMSIPVKLQQTLPGSFRTFAKIRMQTDQSICADKSEKSGCRYSPRAVKREKAAATPALSSL